MLPAFLSVHGVDKNAQSGGVKQPHGQSHRLIERVLSLAGIGTENVLQGGRVIILSAQVVALTVGDTGQTGFRIQRHEGELGTQRVVGVGISQDGTDAGDEFLSLDGVFLSFRQQTGQDFRQSFSQAHGR